MKLPVLLLAGSLAANVALIATFVFHPSLLPPSLSDAFGQTSKATGSKTVSAPLSANASTAAISKSLPQFWSTLQSDDLHTLLGRLRAAGFSPTLIRAIITARAGAAFDGRMRELAASVTNVPFWQTDPLGGMNSQAFFEKMNLLYRERSRVVRELLGDEYFVGAGVDPKAALQRQYGNLTPQKIDLLQRINDDYTELNSQIRQSMQGITLPEDREKLALLEKEKRADLAAALTPEELADYDLRTSRVTGSIRNALTLMNASEQEFRTIFKVEQPYADRLFPTMDGGTPNFEDRRKAAIEVDDQLKAALGDARYADFVRSNNNEFQQLDRIAARENVPEEKAIQAFDLRDTVSTESNRIFDDKEMTTDQKRAALQALAESTKAQLTATLGVPAATAYLRTATWLTQVQGGGAVRFNPGNSTNFRSLPPPGATARARN